MKVLVSAGTKHGSTGEIAGAIADTLRQRGLEVTVEAPERVTGVDQFDAFVLGSAVYAGHWMKNVRELVDRSADALSDKPVWLFSSGPLGVPPKPEEDPVDVADILEATGAREHRIFAGKLERSRLGFGERALVRALRAPEGDFRDWIAIKGWAAAIASTLAEVRR